MTTLDDLELSPPQLGFLDDLVTDIVTRINASVPPVRALWFDKRGLTEPREPDLNTRPARGGTVRIASS